MKRTIILAVVFIICMSFAGCGKGGSSGDAGGTYFYKSLNDKEDTSEIVSTEQAEQELFLIMAINSADETMRVYRYANGIEYQYYYGMTTEFCNKYGDHTSLANFSVGDAIYISETDSTGRVTKVTKADSVWVYEDISKFSLDAENEILEIGDSKYLLDEDTFVFNKNEKAELEKISSDDELCVVGKGSKILSVSVTSGHGTLALKNTKLFEGSYLQLNDNIFVEITKDMTMDLPEGDYTLVVANDGWGGTKEISIKSGETTKVNLDKIKGDGPKFAKILFEVDVADARILVDNKEVDYSAPIELKYGPHSLTVMAEGYTTWNRTLYVNSEEATIVISLTDTDSGKKNDQGENDSENKNSESNNSEKSDSEKKDSSNSDEDLSDYLSTLSELLDSIY